jgi:hypothetical protein
VASARERRLQCHCHQSYQRSRDHHPLDKHTGDPIEEDRDAEFKKRISVGNFLLLGHLIVAAYSFFAGLALEYVKSLRTTTFVTSALLAVSAVIVVFMMRAAPYSWTD